MERNLAERLINRPRVFNFGERAIRVNVLNFAGEFGSTLRGTIRDPKFHARTIATTISQTVSNVFSLSIGETFKKVMEERLTDKFTR